MAIAHIIPPGRRSMTLREFEQQQASLACHFCQKVGYLTPFKVLAGHLGLECHACQHRHALGYTLWLDQSAGKAKRRKDYPMGQSIAEVWERFKNRCAVCTLPLGALAEIGIGPTNHHVTQRYSPDEYDCPIVPVCNACKAFVDARQREAWRWHNRLQELKREPVPASSTGVPESRVSPDPVRAERQASARPVEGLSDHDADA